MTGLE
jgi:hypothetical protein